jgi:arginine/ornithine transport system substrate-binding protein
MRDGSKTSQHIGRRVRVQAEFKPTNLQSFYVGESVMKARFAIVNLLAVLGLFTLPANAADTSKSLTKLRIGVEGGYAPFSVKDSTGKFSGFDIDIANAVCAQMKVECALVETSFDGMIPALKVRKIDLIVASMAITDARKKSVNFSDKYFDSPSRMVARSDAKFVVSDEGMSGKKIGVQRGTIQDNFISVVFKKAVVKHYAKVDEVYIDLANGRLDAVLDDAVSASDGFLKTPAGKGFAFIGPEFKDRKYFGDGVGIAMRKTDADLLARVNVAIAEIRKNGEFKKIQDKYFDFEIFPN